MSGDRWPVGPLEAAVGGSVPELALRLEVSERTIYRWRAEGLSDRLADHLAIRVGLHPATVWTDWSRDRAHR